MYLESIIASGTYVCFKFSDGEIVNGEILTDTLGIFINMPTRLNDCVFRKLGLDSFNFIRSVVGYKPTTGQWPFVKNRKDLDKVLSALRKYNNPNYYHVNSHMGMEKAMSLMIDSQAKKSDNIISVRKKPKTKLNFKL